MNSPLPRIFIVAGEASGDMYGAKLIDDLKKAGKHFQARGMGGDKMQKSGAEILVNFKELSVIGISDIPSKIKKIYHAFQTIKKAILKDNPDLLILIDFPDFNLRMAKAAKKAGIKVLYYISPQIWAWRKGRIKIIKRYVDHMAVILPFELDIYKKANVPATYIRHPLLDMVKPSMSVDAAKTKFGLNPAKTTIGILPGSRKKEIEHILPTMLEAAKLLKIKFPDAQFIMPLASSLDESDIEKCTDTLELKIIKDYNYDVMQVCDAIMATSGTATLEVALMGIPNLIVYKFSPLNYFLGKIFISVPFIGLCNLIAGRKIVAELIQDNATPANIATEIEKILNDAEYRNQIVCGLKTVKDILSTTSMSTIEDVIANLNKSTSPERAEIQ